MPGDNWIYAYYQGIKDGTYTVGRWVRLIYERIVHDLEARTYYFDQKKANDAIEYIESHAFHTEGVKAPGNLILELWQKALLSVIFGIVDVNGNRQFRECLIVMGRKNGKTLLSSAVAEYMAFADGEYGARICFAAPKLQQATLCFNAFFQSIRNEPELDALAQKRRTDVYIESTNSSAHSTMTL